MAWTEDFAHCQSCGTTERKHKAKGLCANCYALASEERQKSHNYTNNPPFAHVDSERRFRNCLSVGPVT